ncbi:YceI family protein [Flavobacterium sp. 3-218]
MKTLKSIFLIVVVTFFTLQLNAQKKYSVDSKSTFEVAGTSTVHDWVMRSTEGNGTAVFNIKDNKLNAINSLTVILPAESLKSSKTSMDNVAYEALDTKNNKTIEYLLKSAQKLSETSWEFTGSYTIAGVSKEYKTQVNITASNGNFILQGANQVTFADFEMAPPKAALGVVKAGKDLTILFNITLTDYAKNDNTLVIN